MTASPIHLTPEQRRRFSALLLDIFSEERLRAHVRQVVPDVANAIPSHQVAYNVYCDHLVDELERQGVRDECIDTLLLLPEARGRQADLLEFKRTRDTGDDVDCPYPGLAAFRPGDHARFFGRRAESGELFALLRRHRWLWIEGASGVGKSSLVAAGLLPLLSRDNVPWTIAVMRPGAHPVDNLARALFTAARPGGPLDALTHGLAASATALRSFIRQHTPAGARFLLCVDQLEESRTFADPAQAQQFDQLLAAALDDAEPRFHLVTTIRIDQVGELLNGMPELERRINESWVKRYTVRPIAVAELTDVIAAPAAACGRRFQDGLVATIRDDAAALFADATSGSLPLLAHALRELWLECAGAPELSIAAYQRLGGLEGALTRSAEEALVQLEHIDPSARERVRRLLLALATVDRQDRWTRQTIPRPRALEAIGGQKPEVLLACLSGQSVASARPPMRFVTTSSQNDQGRVDLIHETLLARWKTLKDWLAEAEEAKRSSAALHEAAEQWQQAGSERAALPGGLLRAKYLKAEPSDQDPALDQRFQEAMRADAQAELAEQRRRRLEIRVVIGVLSALVVAFGIVTVLAVQRRSAVERESTRTRMLLASATRHADKLVDTTRQMAGVCPEDVQDALMRAVGVLMSDINAALGQPAAEPPATPPRDDATAVDADWHDPTSSAPATGDAATDDATTGDPPPDAPKRPGKGAKRPTVASPATGADQTGAPVESGSTTGDAPTSDGTSTTTGADDSTAQELAAGRDCSGKITAANSARDQGIRFLLMKEAIDCVGHFMPKSRPARDLHEGSKRRLVNLIEKNIPTAPSRDAALDLIKRAERLDLDPDMRLELAALRRQVPAAPNTRETKATPNGEILKKSPIEQQRPGGQLPQPAEPLRR